MESTMITEHADRARAAGETRDAAGRQVRDPGVRKSWSGPAGRATQPHAERGRRPIWAGPRGGRNGGRGGAAGPGHRSTAELGRARKWVETAEKRGSTPRSGHKPPPTPSGGPPPGVCLLEAVGCLPPEVVYGGDRLQMEEMEGQRVAAATKAKRGRTAGAAAAHKDDDTDDD